MIKITYDNKFNTKLVLDLEGKAKSKELELLWRRNYLVLNKAKFL